MLNIKITTAGKKSEKISDIPASAVIITRADIEMYGYMSLEEILENVPGMYVIEHPTYRETHGVRGYYAGAPRNIIFLVNGVPQTDGVLDYNILSNFQIPVEAIDRIEVVRGPMSVIYGQGAFFGAINIITNDPSDESRLVSFSLGEGMMKSAAVMSGKKKDFQFAFSAGIIDSDGPDYSLDESVSDLSSLEMWGIDNTNNTTKDRLEREVKNFLFSGRYNQFYTEMSLNQSVEEIFIYRPSVTTGSPYDREMVTLTFGYEDQVTERIKLNGKMSYHYFSFDLDWDITSSIFEGNHAGTTHGLSEEYEFELDMFVDITSAVDLTAGLYYKTWHDTLFKAAMPIFNLFYEASITDRIDLWATFFQLNYHPWEKMRIVTGLRFEQLLEYDIVEVDQSGSGIGDTIESRYSEDDIELIPSVAVLYSFDPDYVLKVLFGKSIARPSFFQNRDQMREFHPNLETEKIQTVEVNYIAAFSPKFSMNVSLFHNVLDNLIVRSIEQVGDELIEYATNGGKVVTKGAELTMHFKPLKKCLAELSVTYQDSEDQREGFENIDVAYSPQLLGYMKMSYAIDENMTLAFTGTYVDEMETEWDVRLNDHAGGRIGKPVDDYFLLGANLRINDLFGNGYYLNIRGSNILDTSYAYPTYVNNTWADKGTPGDPMQFLVTVGKKF